MRIYLDYAASTPLSKNAYRAMKPYFSVRFGNPGSLHSFGQEVIAALDKSREEVARAIGADFHELVFTGSATEANNLALIGAVRASRIENPRVIVSSIEHESVLEVANNLEREGVEVLRIPVTKEGMLHLKALKEAITENTVFVSVMYVNNEVGTVEPIKEISKIISDFRRERESKNTLQSLFPLFHTDAAQAFQYFDCNVRDLGVDMMTISAQKIYGPKGVGGLYIRREQMGKTFSTQYLSPLMHGGGQEFGFRPGTENIPLIVGFATASRDAVALRSSRVTRTNAIRYYFWKGLKKIIKNAEINGEEIKNKLTTRSAPHILNVYTPRRRADDLLMKLDMMGIAVSSGSACRSRSPAPSYVLRAMGCPKPRILESVRFSFGSPTTKEDIDTVLRAIRKLVTK